MVDSRILCRKHLCGEHVETHMFLGHMKIGKGVDGYITNNCLQMCDLYKRHEELSLEMESRGYNHNSPMDVSECNLAIDKYPNDKDCKVNSKKSLVDLLDRCMECRSNFISLGVRTDQVLK